MKICPNCNIEYNDDTSFCGNCGAQLVQKIDKQFCPYCGKELDNEYRFCPYSGKEISVKQNIQENTVEQPKVNKIYGVIKPVPNKVVYGIARPIQQKEEKKPSTGRNIFAIIVGIIGVIFGGLASGPIKIAMRGSYGSPATGITSSTMEAVLVLLLISAACCFLTEKLHPRWGKSLVWYVLTVMAGTGTFNPFIGFPGTVIIIIIAAYFGWKFSSKKQPIETSQDKVKVNTTNEPEFNSQDKKKKIITTIGICLIVAAVGGSIYYMGNQDKLPKERDYFNDPGWEYLFTTTNKDKLFFKKDEIKVETGIVDNYLDWKMANRSPRKGKIVNVWLRYVYTKDSKIFSKDSRAKLPTGTAFCQELVQFQLDDPHYVRYMEDHFYSKEGRWLDGKYLDKHWYRSNHTDFQDRVKIYVDIPKN